MPDDTTTLHRAQTNLLVPYQGKAPPAPNWFTQAVETPYESHVITVDDVPVRYQSWGDPSAPGILLVHGNGAHAHWYDFIAPYLAQDHHVVAMTFSGMGDSGWREKYSIVQFSEEQMAVCAHSGLFSKAEKPILIAHSFGGFVTLQTGADHSDQFSGIIIVDSPIRPPEDNWDGPPKRGGGNRVYADLTGALSRFRLAPPQGCENHFIVDYIARHSLKQVSEPGGPTGWTWKFDPFIWQHFEAAEPSHELVKKISCRLSYMRGEHSGLVTDRIWTYMQSLRPDARFISIPEADHHVMLDQPLAFVAATRAQIAAWREN